MKKRVLCAALASMMALSMTACSSGSTATTAAETKASEAETTTEEASSEKAEETTEGGTLIVGFDQDFPPMGFLGDNGEYTGFDLELAQEVAKRLGLEYKAQPIAWDAKDMELESGNIDCIWNGFTITGREDDYTWTEPYMANTQVFVVRNDSGIAGKDDLAGKVVECQADSSAEAALKEDPDLTATFAQLFAIRNLCFMVFNIIPIPPLDGAKVLGMFLPNKAYYTMLRYERYSMLLIMVLSLTGVLNGIIGTGVNFFFNGIINLLNSAINLIL